MKRFQLSLLVLATAGALAACGDNVDERTAGERVDDTVARAKGAAAEVKQEAREATASTRVTPQDSAAVAGSARPDTATMGAAPDARAADAQITARVNQALADQKDLRAVRIDVDTRDGVVTLSGAVQSAATKARVTEVAKGVKDVKSVNDQLTLAAG
jgi:hyperosmotically inducible periplasmic protein